MGGEGGGAGEVRRREGSAEIGREKSGRGQGGRRVRKRKEYNLKKKNNMNYYM